MLRGALVLSMAVLVSMSATVGTAHADILRAKPAASGSGDCSTWDDACTLQAALAAAVSGDEIWVMQGSHTPGAARTDTFALKSGVGVYGGFAGAENARDERDAATNPTILSGDIGTPGNNSDNTYHVVTGSNTTATAVLDGFTVSGGNADGQDYPHYQGGGMYCDSGSPTLSNVTFSGNSARDGGGLRTDSGSPTLTNVTFSSNSAVSYGGGVYTYSGSPEFTTVTLSNNSAENAGGMFCSYGTPTLTNVAFSGNSASANGGGMFTVDSTPTLTNVTFSGNSAHTGGGLYLSRSNASLTNATFSGNSAVGDYASAGGICADTSSPTLTNVTFTNNSARHVGGAMWNWASNPTLKNVILWNDTAWDGSEIYNQDSSSPTVTDSVVQGGCPADSTCTNIVTTDPMLGPLADNGGFTRTHALLPGSSAVDAGGQNSSCASTDQRGVGRPQGTGCDIGAFEVTSSEAPRVVATSLAVSYLGVGPGSLTVTFSEPMSNAGGGTGPDDVGNPANYMLVEAGGDGAFDTATCAGGVVPDDVPVTVDLVAYDSGTFTATLTINGGTPLPPGSYRLLVSGTTTIMDMGGYVLNGGSDFVFDFDVQANTIPALGLAGLAALAGVIALLGGGLLLGRRLTA